MIALTRAIDLLERAFVYSQTQRMAGVELIEVTFLIDVRVFKWETVLMLSEVLLKFPNIHYSCLERDAMP